MNKIQVKLPHQRTTYAEFEDRSQEETAKTRAMRPRRRVEIGLEYLKAPRKEKDTFISLTNEWFLPAASTIKPEEREFAVAIVRLYLRWVVSRKIQMHSFLMVEVPGKPDAKSLGISSKSSVHSVHATSSKYPRRERIIAWKKYKSNILISEVPTL